MIKYFRSKKKLIREMSELEHKITEQECKRWFDEKLALIREYEGKIISSSAKAADDRELDMLKIIDTKEKRIRDLELEIIDLKNSYRDVKEDIQENEIISQELNIDIQSATTIMAQLAAKFDGMIYKMKRVNQRIIKKDKKLIEEGKS